MELRQSQQVSTANYAGNCNSQYHFHRLSNLQKIRSQSLKTTLKIYYQITVILRVAKDPLIVIPNSNPSIAKYEAIQIFQIDIKVDTCR